MKTAEHTITRNINANAVNVPSFFMRRVSNPSPKPSQNYHYHDCYELYFLHSGDRYYFIDDKTYHVAEGSVVFITPSTIHCSCNFEKKGYDRTVMYFKREFVDDILTLLGVDFFGNYGACCHILTTGMADRELFRRAAESMQSVYDSDIGDNAYLKASLVHLLLFISKIGTTSRVPPIEYANPTHKMISEITGYINNNYSGNITLAEISRRYFISPCYFSRTFRALCGISFTEYLNSVRIKAACDLLTDTDDSITDIAHKVGFNGNTHFTRVFKKLTGASPSEYRKANR